MIYPCTSINSNINEILMMISMIIILLSKYKMKDGIVVL